MSKTDLIDTEAMVKGKGVKRISKGRRDLDRIAERRAMYVPACVCGGAKGYHRMANGKRGACTHCEGCEEFQEKG